jgi:predicted transcriptional regulator
VAKDRLVDGHWTGYNPSLDRSILKKAKFLEEEEKGPAVEVAEQAAAQQSVATMAPAPPIPAAAPASKPPPNLPSPSRTPTSPRNCKTPGVRALEMPRNGAREIPPPLELECLKALWTLGEGNVKDVRAALTSSRNLAYTTVMTLLDRLARKGGVTRRKVGRRFVYAPALSRGLLRRLAVEDLVDRYFDGSHEALEEYLRGGDTAQAGAGKGAVEEELDPTLL